MLPFFFNSEFKVAIWNLNLNYPNHWQMTFSDFSALDCFIIKMKKVKQIKTLKVMMSNNGENLFEKLKLRKWFLLDNYTFSILFLLWTKNYCNLTLTKQCAILMYIFLPTTSKLAGKDKSYLKTHDICR